MILRNRARIRCAERRIGILSRRPESRGSGKRVRADGANTHRRPKRRLDGLGTSQRLLRLKNCWDVQDGERARACNRTEGYLH